MSRLKKHLLLSVLAALIPVGIYLHPASRNYLVGQAKERLTFAEAVHSGQLGCAQAQRILDQSDEQKKQAMLKEISGLLKDPRTHELAFLETQSYYSKMVSSLSQDPELYSAAECTERLLLNFKSSAKEVIGIISNGKPLEPIQNSRASSIKKKLIRAFCTENPACADYYHTYLDDEALDDMMRRDLIYFLATLGPHGQELLLARLAHHKKATIQPDVRTQGQNEFEYLLFAASFGSDRNRMKAEIQKFVDNETYSLISRFRLAQSWFYQEPIHFELATLLYSLPETALLDREYFIKMSISQPYFFKKIVFATLDFGKAVLKAPQSPQLDHYLRLQTVFNSTCNHRKQMANMVQCEDLIDPELSAQFYDIHRRLARSLVNNRGVSSTTFTAIGQLAYSVLARSALAKAEEKSFKDNKRQQRKPKKRGEVI